MSRDQPVDAPEHQLSCLRHIRFYYDVNVRTADTPAELKEVLREARATIRPDHATVSYLKPETLKIIGSEAEGYTVTYEREIGVSTCDTDNALHWPMRWDDFLARRWNWRQRKTYREAMGSGAVEGVSAGDGDGKLPGVRDGQGGRQRLAP